MDSTWKTALTAAVVAGAVAWFVARSSTGGSSGDGADASAALTARVDALERTLAATRGAPVHDERAVARRLDAIEARLPAAPNAGSAEGAPAPAPNAATPTPEDKARQEVIVGLATEPAGEDHRAALKRLATTLVTSAGPPFAEKDFAWAAGLLDREARRERVTAQDAEEIAPMLQALPSGHAARPVLAKAAVVGWAADARLGALLDRFPANAEPSLHQGVLSVLDDEHPSPAFSEYVIRMVRDERNPSVLGVALGLDRIEAAATVAAAPRIVQTIETRLADGSLDGKTRVRACLAVAVASLRIPESGVAALRRVADRETDAKLAERCRGAAAALQSGEATLKALERLFE